MAGGAPWGHGGCSGPVVLHLGSSAPTFKSPRAGPVPTGVTPRMPSKGNGHGRGLSPTSSLPVPDLSARRQDPSPLGSHWVWVHTPHLGPPEPQRQLSRAHISPCLPPDHTRSAQARAGGAGGLGRAGSRPLTRPDQQSPRQGGSQAPGRRGHRGLLEEARRTPLAPVPVSPGACPLPWVLCPHPVGPTSPLHHHLRPLHSGHGGAGTGRAAAAWGTCPGSAAWLQTGRALWSRSVALGSSVDWRPGGQ